MDLREFGAALVRRWYLAIVMIVLAVGGAVVVGRYVGTKYTAVATAVLVPPQSTVEAASRTANYAPPNPLLYLGGLNQSRDVLIRALSNQEMADAVKQQVPGASADVSGDSTSSGPLVIITGQAQTEDGALSTLGLVKTRMPVVLSSIQQELGIAQQNQITVLVLTSDDRPTADRKAQIQAGVLSATAIGVIGALLLAMFDSVRLARRRAMEVAPSNELGLDDRATPVGANLAGSEGQVDESAEPFVGSRGTTGGPSRV